MPSATIAKGGTAQSLTGPSTFRRGLSLQNNSTGDIRLVQGGADASGSNGVRIAPSAYYETPVNRFAGGSWSVWGGTDGQAFNWEEW